MSLPCPWHERAWKIVQAYDHRLPHAFLLTGNRGLGKEKFAYFLADYLLCRQRGEGEGEAEGKGKEGACGKCRSCHLINANTHPDKKVIAPRNQILLEQIHQAREFCQQKAHFEQGARVVIILAAELMNRSAAGALLKILEEPPPDKYFILISSKPGLILPTIHSRCVDLHFSSVSLSEFSRWVGREDPLLYDLSLGAPLYAAQLLDSGDAKILAAIYKSLDRLTENSEDPIELSLRWQELGDSLSLMDILDVIIYYMENNMREFGDSQQAFNVYDTLLARRQLVHSLFNLNRTLLLEECLILLRGLRTSQN